MARRRLRREFIKRLNFLLDEVKQGGPRNIIGTYVGTRYVSALVRIEMTEVGSRERERERERHPPPQSSAQV